MEEWKNGGVEECENLKIRQWKYGNMEDWVHTCQFTTYASRLATADFSMRFALCSLPKN